jgi:hypothetical protein
LGRGEACRDLELALALGRAERSTSTFVRGCIASEAATRDGDVALLQQA